MNLLQNGYTYLMPLPFSRVCVWLLLLASGTLVQAQIVIPNFGTRGDVPTSVSTIFMNALRGQVAGATGLQVRAGELVTTGIAGSLAPEFTHLIARIGEGRYGVSGEIAVARGGGYTITILIADDETERVSELFSQSMMDGEYQAAARAVSRFIGEFVTPRDALPAGNAELFVSSQPPEAEVWINGQRVGVTGELQPLAFAPGRYEIEFRKVGYLPFYQSVDLQVEQLAFVSAVLTPVVGGSILVSSTPSNAEIYLEGELVGRTPLVVEALPGQREVRLQHPGFEPEVVSVLVRNFRPSRVMVELNPSSERLIFWEPIRGTLVFVNGLLRVENYVRDLRAGLHTVELWRGEERVRFRVVLPITGVFRLDLTARELIPYLPEQ